MKFRGLSRLVITIAALVMAFSLAWGQSSDAKKVDQKAKASAAANAMKFWNTDQGKWSDSATIPGLHSMVVSGDPDTGPSVQYLKVDPGVKIPWHWHTPAEVVYGDGGSLEIRTQKGDHKMNVTSGSYARMPGHMIHNATCVSKEPCTLYIESPAKFDMHAVDDKGKEIQPKEKI